MEEAVGYNAIECHGESKAGGTLTLKHGRMFLVADRRGDLDPPGHCGLGFYHDDTRVLSRYRLTVPGDTVSVLSCQDRSMYGAQIDLAVPDPEVPGTDVRANRHSVHIRREMLLDDRFVERVTLTSFLTHPVDYWVDLGLGADFADIFEVRGWRRERRGTYYRPVVSDDAIDYRYRGTDGQTLRTQVRFLTPPQEVRPDGARWHTHLTPGAKATLEWQVVPDVDPRAGSVSPGVELEDRWEPLAASYRGWRQECTAWQSDVDAFNTTVEQAVVDMHALYVEADGHDVISAGIPWYSTAFGRDSLITSLQTLPLNPRIARETLQYLARHQGEKEDPFTEEQPGKILHEVRRGELARSGEIPHVPYYGTVDATPLWLVLLHETWRWTGDAELVRELLPHAERALEWIDRYGDVDGDGLVEYARSSERGLANQGWKDSGDGVPFPDGRLAEPPIALVEVQGYVYDAKVRMAGLYRIFGREEEATRLREEAAVLRGRILERFWMEEVGTFALALDGRKRPVPSATSNAGHLLWSRVPTREQAARMARHFASPDMFSGWGLRTLSAAHPVFNPMSYHNGSIWPHDNALVGLGLALAGHTEVALWIFTALHEAATGLTYHRLPELYCGMERAGGASPVLYPVSCSPQAWAAGAVFMLLQAATGILPDGPSGELHIREPELPPFLDALDVRGLHVGGARADLRFRRHRGRTMANLLGVEGGPLNVRIELTG
jgi:glycogen debranching enzyme